MALIQNFQVGEIIYYVQCEKCNHVQILGDKPDLTLQEFSCRLCVLESLVSQMSVNASNLSPIVHDRSAQTNSSSVQSTDHRSPKARKRRALSPRATLPLSNQFGVLADKVDDESDQVAAPLCSQLSCTGVTERVNNSKSVNASTCSQREQLVHSVDHTLPRQSDSNRSVIVCGSSNVRHFRPHLSQRGSRQVVLNWLSGGRVCDLMKRLKPLIENSPSDNVLVVLHVGVNDVVQFSTNCIMYEFCQVAEQLSVLAKSLRKTVNLSICSLPPRFKPGGGLSSSAIISAVNLLNSKLLDWCEPNGVHFLDMRATQRSSLSDDNLHYSRDGATAVCDIIRLHINHFLFPGKFCAQPFPS
jgi:hypothetical protein